MGPQTYEAVLTDGRAVVAPEPDEQAALERVAVAGLVRVRHDVVFRCFDPAEDACAYHPTRVCGAWVPFREDDTTTCPACGLDHECSERVRLRERTLIRLDRDAVVAWIEAACRSFDVAVRRLREGVAWSLALPEQDVVVVWLDGSLGTRLVTRPFATSQTVVYVVADPRPWSARFREDPWLAPLSLGAWFAGGEAALLAAVARASAGPGLASEPATRPWAAERSVEARVLVRPLGTRSLAVSDAGATLDGVEVVARDATGVLPVLRVLIDRWRDDVGAGKAPDDHCVFTVDEIRGELAAGSDTPPPKPDTLRRQLGRLRAGIVERYHRETGVSLDEGAVVELVGLTGYRLNPRLMVVAW